LFVPATSASHGCLPAYNASLQGPSTSSDSQLSAYNASLQVQPTSSDSHTVNPGTGLPIMSTFTQPQYTSRVTDGIGDNVSNNIRNKILLGEYIDLPVLLNNSNSNNTHDNQKIAFINGELIVQQKQNAPNITSIETWTDAFIIYMNIY
jgi:hypothetical protein